MPCESIPLLSEVINTSAHIRASSSGTPIPLKTSTIKFSKLSKSTQIILSEFLYKIVPSLFLMFRFLCGFNKLNSFKFNITKLEMFFNYLITLVM